jgi:predicted nucleotidyltransferase
MATPITADPVLVRFRRQLEEIYGDRLERVVLYGSRARGEASAESDYDLAVFIRDLDDRWAELRRLGELGSEILFGTGEFIHALPYAAGAYEERTPLMREIRHEGIDL